MLDANRVSPAVEVPGEVSEKSNEQLARRGPVARSEFTQNGLSALAIPSRYLQKTHTHKNKTHI